MKKHLGKTLGILAVLTITTSLSGMEQLREIRAAQQRRYEQHLREEEERQRHQGEEQREATQRHEEEARLAQARENIERFIRNENIEEILREQLVAARDSENISNIDSMIAIAQDALIEKQRERIDPIINEANRAIEQAQHSRTQASEGLLVRTIQDLRYQIAALADGHNALSGEYKETVDAKIQELENHHTALAEELQRQPEQRSEPEHRAPARSGRGSSSTESPASLTQLQTIQRRIELAESTARIEGSAPTDLKNELVLLRKDLVKFIGKCYTENKEYLRQQADLTKNQLDEKIETLERRGRASSTEADEALARRLAAEESQRVEDEHSRWAQ